MASIRKRGKSWEAQVRMRGWEPLTRNFTTKADAIQWASEREAEMRRGTFIDTTSLRSLNGGISVFLCSNLGNGPAGTQACPNPSGSVRGTITAANVIGPAGQEGIGAGEFDKLAQALRAGVAYVNVHTQQFPGGEIRAQLRIDD